VDTKKINQDQPRHLIRRKIIRRVAVLGFVVDVASGIGVAGVFGLPDLLCTNILTAASASDAVETIEPAPAPTVHESERAPLVMPAPGGSMVMPMPVEPAAVPRPPAHHARQMLLARATPAASAEAPSVVAPPPVVHARVAPDPKREPVPVAEPSAPAAEILDVSTPAPVIPNAPGAPPPAALPAASSAVPPAPVPVPAPVPASVIPQPPTPAPRTQTAPPPQMVFVPLPLPRREPPPPTPAEQLGLVGKERAKERAKAEKCLAQAIYFEARAEPVRGQVAVAQVVLNRVFSPYYPKDVCSVVYQNAHRRLACQFTFACDGKPETIRERGAWAGAQRIAKQALDAKVWLPEVAKATHYHATYVRPVWRREMKKMVRHGVHIFYRPYRWGDGSKEPGWGVAAVQKKADARSARN
jgi:spore germination cell wall hydrolase CwlJ-like protein